MGKRGRRRTNDLPRRYTRWREALDGPCRKRAYDTKRECLEAIKVALVRSDQPAPDQLRAYKCQHCKKWHMTSQEPRRPPWQSRRNSRQ